MKYKLLETIVCPDCKKALECIVFDEKDEVIDGFLSCNNCGKTYPIVNSIPRMVENRLLRETESFKHFIEKYRNRLPVEYNYGKSDKLVSQKTKKEIKTMKAFGFEWTKWTSSVHTTATKKINEKIEGDRFFEQTQKDYLTFILFKRTCSIYLFVKRLLILYLVLAYFTIHLMRRKHSRN
jgi:uncharacterized protein YbaR (Trm112 family)